LVKPRGWRLFGDAVRGIGRFERTTAIGIVPVSDRLVAEARNLTSEAVTLYVMISPDAITELKRLDA
jgi:hypothetical protein